MGTEGSPSGNALREALEVFSRVDSPGTPLTASEVADELDCARRTAYGKLERLAERGELETKKVGARGRVWWRPPERPETGTELEEGRLEDERLEEAAERAAEEERPAEERTEESEAEEASADDGLERTQFHELVGAVADYAIFVLDPGGTVLTWNDGARRIKGYEEDEIVGEHFSRFYTEGDREAGRPERNLGAARDDGRIEDEGWRVRKDGSRFWANVMITALRDDGGELRGYVKITRDMTDRHEYEERLRTEKERFETLVSEVKDYAIFMLDPDGIVRTWNEGARELKGYEREAIVGEHFSQFYTESDREAGRPERNLERAAEEGRVEDEGERVRNDGETFWANVTITALRDDGDLRGFAKVTRDMTDRHRYEERLREQRDELEELDRINAVIRDIDQVLVTATSREEIEQAVCDRLAESDTYAAAWIGEYTDDYAEITPRTWTDIDDDYLTAIRDVEGDAARETEKGVGSSALRTRTIQPVQRLRSDLEGEPWREASLEEGYESAITVPLVYDEVEYGVLTVYADDETAFDERKVAVMSELGETISHAIAAIRRKERERTLTALQESTHELLRAETPSEIGDVIVDTFTDGLALADALVYYFDTNENALEPVSSSYRSESAAERLTSLSAGADSPVWTSFVEGESRVTESVLPAGEIDERRTMVVPLGEHGVLAVAAAQREAFDENVRSLVSLVGATAEAAFDRVESQANLRERDELLQEQNQRLQRLNGINTLIREVDQGLVQAASREEIQRVVCDKLTTSDRFRFAWIGTPDDVDEGLTPRARSGEDRGYLDGVDLAPGERTEEIEPAVAAARTDDVTVVSNVAEQLRDGEWRREAFQREFQSVISVPLIYGDVTYGVLSVYADRPGVFAEMEQSVFAELGETVANAINAVDAQNALLSDRTIELEFRLDDESASVLARLARQVQCEIAFEGVIPLTEDRSRLFFVARDAPADALEDALERSLAVESGQLVADTDDGHLVEAEMVGSVVARSLLEYGASLRTFAVTEDGIRLVVDLPPSRDVREFIERLQTKYESAQFVARRERERPVETREGLYAELESYATDRQLEVLETAYYSGFFDSPRRSTGGDVAELLGVSQPTVTEQLRTAERKILDLLLDDGPART